MDRALVVAQGKALTFLAAILQRCGVIDAREFGDLLGTFAVSVDENDPDVGDILAAWAGIVLGSVEQVEPDGLSAPTAQAARRH